MVVPDGQEPAREPDSRHPSLWMLVLGAVAVVALLFASRGGGETPDTETTVPTVPEVVDTANGWELLGLPGADRLLAVTPLAPTGYVAVGAGPQFWFSPDGQTWRLGTVREEGVGEAAGVTELASLKVAVGSDVADTGQIRPSVWTSGDGLSWRQVLKGSAPAALEGVTAGDGRLYAWGWKGSDQDFSPAVGSLVMTSTNGTDWSEVTDLPQEARIHRVVFLNGTWYVMGLQTGQPALWRWDGETWTGVSSNGFPFGWAMVDLYREGAGLVANLGEVGLGRTRTFRQGVDGWAPITDPIVNGPVVMLSPEEAVGAGRLWENGPQWSPVDVEGEVAAATGPVAVGSAEGQPALWVEDPATRLAYVPPSRGSSPGWALRADLGQGQVHGPWPVADGWLVGVGSNWWFVGDGEPRAVTDLAGASVAAVDRVDGEWVAIPDMLWSSDGISWEPRSLPWASADTGTGYVAAVSTFAGGIQAIGQDDAYLWVSAVSADAGSSWQVVQRRAITPIYRIRPVPDGFVGVAARPRSTQAVVRSSDGFEWEGLSGGRLIDVSQPPALLDQDGLVFLDDMVAVPPPRHDITAVIETGGGSVQVVAGGALWVGDRDGNWSRLPLDPTHGIGGAVVAPVPTGADPGVLVSDHGRVTVMRWPG